MRLISTRTCALLIAGGMLTGLVVTARPYLHWDESRLPRHLIERIKAAEDAAAAAMVPRLEPTTAAAMDALVELAVSPRAAVAHAAQQRLDAWMFSIERRGAIANAGGDAEIAELALSLSNALARQANEFGPAGGQWARQLSRRLLDLVHLVPERNRVLLIRDCELVLLAGREPSGESGSLASRVSAETRGAERRALNAASSPQRMLRLAMQPGPLGTRPAAAVAMTDSHADETSPSPDPEGTRDQHVSGISPEPLGEALTAYGPAVPVSSGPDLEWRSRRGDHYARIAPQALANRETLDVPSPAVSRSLEDELLHAPLADVIAALASEDPFATASAKAVLRARGMSDADLQIARRLIGADAPARRLLLDEASSRRGSNTTAWLHYFAEDDAAEVRLRALTLLATSRDEAVLQQVYARAVQDDDARVRALAKRLDTVTAEARQ